jgi:hypothetical protein
MNPATLTAVGVALGTVLVAMLAYIAASLQARTAAIHAKAASDAAIAAAVPPRAPRRATDPVGGGHDVGADPKPARAFPLWDQLADPLSTGVLAEQRYNECGEECCAEVIYQQHGVEVNADALRAQIHGAGGTGLTTGMDLVKILTRNNVPAVRHPWSLAEARVHLQASSAAGRAVIVLGRWISPTILHWVLVTAADGAGVSYNDPWGGLRIVIDWATFTERYAGELVTVTRAADVAA